MLTTIHSMQVLTVSESVASFATPRVVVAPCERMDVFSGKFAYTGGAPVAPPEIELSMNGTDWDTVQSAPLGVNAAFGVTLYSWSIPIVSWAFVRLTVSPPIGSVRGAAKIRPVIEN